MTIPDDTEPSAEALAIAEALWMECVGSPANYDNGPVYIALALDRFRAAERERAVPVIEWAREAVTAMEARASWSLAHDQLRKALAAYDGASP